MTMTTYCFTAHKRDGFVRKIGTAWFLDGNRHTVRTLWYDTKDMTPYVILNGNAYGFKPYTNQPYEDDGIIIGHI